MQNINKKTRMKHHPGKKAGKSIFTYGLSCRCNKQEAAYCIGYLTLMPIPPVTTE